MFAVAPILTCDQICTVADCTLQTGVVKEGLRLSSGIPGILPRIVPSQGANVKGQFIPGGVCYFYFIL